MAVDWEWQESGSIERDLVVEKLLSSDNSGFAGGIVYEETESDWIENFSATGVTKSELTALKTNARTRLADYDLTDALGDTWTGYIRSLSWDRIRGTNRYEVSLTLLIPPTEPD